MKLTISNLKSAVLGCMASWLTCAVSFAGPYYWTTTMPAVPAYSSTQQAVFWNSSNNLPEQSVLLSGAFSSAPKTVLLAPLSGASSPSAAVTGSTISVTATSMGYTGLTFTLPSTFSQGPLAYEIQDSSGLALVGTANLPTVYWCEGIASSITPSTAPLHQILSNAVEVGGSLQIFGRDFPLTSYVDITISGVTTQYTVTTQNPYEIVVPISGTQGTGTGTIQVGASSTTDATYSATSPITINAASTLTSTTLDCTSSLVGDGVTDNTTALNNFISSSLPVSSGTVQYITISSSGTYVISNKITLNPGQYLVGASGVSVTIQGSAATPPTTWITGSSYFGLINLTLNAPLATTGTGSLITTDTTNGGHVVLNNDTITATKGGISTTADLYLAGPDIQIVNSTVNGDNNTVSGGVGYGLALAFANGFLFSGSTINLGSLSWNYVNDSQFVAFENSTINGLTTGTANSATGMSLVQGNYAQCILENFYFGDSTISNISGNNREAMTFDGGGCDYEGLLTSSSSSSMVLANTPAFSGGGGYTRVPTDCIISVLAGTGQGQYRFISSYTASTNTVTLTQPWAITPDTNSVVTITGRERHLVFYDNNITNAGPFQIYGGGEDNEIANNVYNTTDGIVLDSLLYGGAYQVVVDTDVINNQMYLNSGSATNQVVLEAFTTGLISGTLVRGNVGSDSAGTLYLTQGGVDTRLSAALEEGDSSPSTSTSIQSQNAMIQLKENQLVTYQPAVGTEINTTAGQYGCEFTVGTRPVTVSQVGRWDLGASTHVVGIYTTAGTLVTGASATVTTTNSTKYRFAYASLSSPVTLSPNTSYLLESTETAAGEKWYDSTTVVCPGNGITINGAAFNTTVSGSINNSYGPVTIVFNDEMPTAQSVSAFASTRNDMTQALGFNFTVGEMPMIVNRLGRWTVSGNTGTHLLQIFDSTNTAVPGASVTVNTSGATAGQYLYGTLASPVTLSANTTYYVESQETSGGDYFYDYSGTVLNPGAGSVINSAETSSSTAGSANNSYGPVNMLSTF